MQPTHVSPGFLQWSDDWGSLSTKFAAVNAGEYYLGKLVHEVELWHHQLLAVTPSDAAGRRTQLRRLAALNMQVQFTDICEAASPTYTLITPLAYAHNSSPIDCFARLGLTRRS